MQRSKETREYRTTPLARSYYAAIGSLPIVLSACVANDPALKSWHGSDVRLVRLIVHVRGAKDGAGPVRCAIYGTRAGFMTRDGIVQGVTLPVSQHGADCEFQVPANRRIAVSAFQDIDSNSEFGRGPLGIPLEPWGTSGEFSPLAPPDWRRSSIEVGSEGGEITIQLTSPPDLKRAVDKSGGVTGPQ